MSHTRELGFSIHEQVANNREMEQQLQDHLCITHQELQKLYEGRLFLTGTDLQKISKVCGVELNTLLTPDRAAYNERVVHYMTAFQNSENREMVLDLIDAYIDAREALEDC